MVVAAVAGGGIDRIDGRETRDTSAGGCRGVHIGPRTALGKPRRDRDPDSEHLLDVPAVAGAGHWRPGGLAGCFVCAAVPMPAEAMPTTKRGSQAEAIRTGAHPRKPRQGMKKYGPTGQYGAFNGSFDKSNPFASPDEYLAFIRTNLPYLMLEAERGHLAHGRGIVLLQRPEGPLIQSWFITCDPTDFKGMRPDAGRDYAEYDLETEFLIAAMNPQETRFQFWRMPEKRVPPNQGKKPGRPSGNGSLVSKKPPLA